MENKTAVDWLRERLPSLFEHDDNGFYAKIFEEAKEMEKEQIIQTFHEARIHVLKNVWKHDDGKRYYQEVYEK